MKKSGILNRDISALLATLGHTDTIIIADSGLPIPNDISCIDVSLKLGTPSFLSVLELILTEMEVEKLILAEEIKTENSKLHVKLIQDNETLPIEYLSHEKLKQRINEVKAVIRTGEATPFANVILQSGVIF
ncbi:D-ribose pyranase [Oceanobacillus sp. FSL H7-0719]|uniref:D-ribose pyranase n=1 Tax=Oceanobacillus sp. FSL H7-0719 TaxID=2954507 RepID=UPI00324CB81D